MNVGDSVSTGCHRLQLQTQFNAAGFTNYDFVGDVAAVGDPSDVDYQAYGGAYYFHMQHGRWVDRGSGTNWEAGVVDAIPRHKPNVFLLLGGYNNMAGETGTVALANAVTEFTNLVNCIISNAPGAPIFISNITDFSPDGDWFYKRQNVLDFNPMIVAAVAGWQEQGARVYLVDNFSIVTHDDLNPDGLHVAPSGQVKIGNNWFASMLDTGVLEPKYDPNDQDSDGLTDLEEIRVYHTDPLNPDSDGDRMPDGNEIIAGTDPTNPFSYLCLAVKKSGAHFAVEWATVTGRVYTVEYTDQLGASAVWNQLITNYPGTGVDAEVFDPVTTIRRYYRITVK